MSSSRESPNRKDQTSATRGPFREAAQSADVVIVTTPWPVTEALVCEHAADLDDKIVIDATNPLNPAETGLALGFLTSGVELLQSQARRAKFFFKTFIRQAPASLCDLTFPKGRPFSSPARRAPTKRWSCAALETVDASELKAARLLEPLAMLMMQLARDNGDVALIMA
jgi:predicted dinucleotide-binding enzyme